MRDINILDFFLLNGNPKLRQDSFLEQL